MKLLLFTIFLILPIITFAQIGNLTEKEQLEVDTLIDYQNNVVFESFQHIPKYEQDSTNYTVNEYKLPNGQIGFQILIETEEYQKAIAYGTNNLDYSFTYLKNSTSTNEIQ